MAPLSAVDGRKINASRLHHHRYWFRFFYSLYSAGSKWLLKEYIREPFLLFMYISVFQCLLTPVLWLFVKPVLPSAEAWWHLSLAGLTCALAYVFIYAHFLHRFCLY